MRNCVDLLKWHVLAGPTGIGSNSPTLPSSAPTPLSPQGSLKH